MGTIGKYNDWLTDDGLTIIRGWARDGLENKEIAKKIGVRAETISDWCRRFPPFSQALKEGRKPENVILEDNLLSRTRWEYKIETTKETFISADGTQTQKITERGRWFPPDSAITIFTTKNRLREKYKDKPIDTSMDGEEGVRIIIDV